MNTLSRSLVVFAAALCLSAQTFGQAAGSNSAAPAVVAPAAASSTEDAITLTSVEGWNEQHCKALKDANTSAARLEALKALGGYASKCLSHSPNKAAGTAPKKGKATALTSTKTTVFESGCANGRVIAVKDGNVTGLVCRGAADVLLEHNTPPTVIAPIHVIGSSSGTSAVAPLPPVQAGGPVAAPAPQTGGGQSGGPFLWHPNTATAASPAQCIISDGNGEGLPPYCSGFKVMGANPGETKNQWLIRVGGGGRAADTGLFQRK